MGSDQSTAKPKEGWLAAVARRAATSSLRSWALPGWARATLLLQAALALVSLTQIANLLHLFRLRVTFPFEHEWMEGAVVDHVQRVLAGDPLYVEPSLSFTPFLYTPLYYGVSAAACHVLGTGLLGPRIVSVAATIACLVLIASFVHRETRDRLAALVAVGWFATTYELTGFWLDIARVDALSLFFLLASTWLARFGRSYAACAGAGATLALAFFTKQSALPFFVPVVSFAFALGWKRALTCAASFALPTTAALAYLHRASDGWFAYYVFDVPGQHTVLWDRLGPHLVDFFVRPVTVPLLLAVVALVLRPGSLRLPRVLAAYALLGTFAFASSYFALLHRDGYVNVLIPAYAVLAILAGIGFARVRQEGGNWPARVGERVTAIACVAWGVAFATLAYDPTRALPSRADRSVGRTMVQTLSAQPKPLWMPGTGHFVHRAGHTESSAHAMALADIFKTREPRIRQQLLEETLTSVRERRWAAIVFDRSFTLFPPEVTEAVHTHYRPHMRVYPPDAHDAGWPRTGFRSRPEEIWVPR